jgi:hypothetical protein
MQMNTSDKNALRKRYRPDPPIRLLMIGESPPRGDNFFYLCQGAVYQHTQSVFERVFGEECVSQGEDFLRWFQAKGCYLEDLCEESTNGMQWESLARKDAWQKGIPRLGAKIGNLKPAAAFVFVKGITKYVEQAIAASNDDRLTSSLNNALADGPMPESRGDPRGLAFERELARWLVEIRTRKII